MKDKLRARLHENHEKWTQTGLKSQTTLKCRSVYMAIYMEITAVLHMCKLYLLINANLMLKSFINDSF